MAMRQRRGGDAAAAAAAATPTTSSSTDSTTLLPLHKKEPRNGADIKPYQYQPMSKSKRRLHQMKTCVKYTSYAIFVLIVLLVLVLRFDHQDRSHVRTKVVTPLQNRVMGNTANYMKHDIVSTFFQKQQQQIMNININMNHNNNNNNHNNNNNNNHNKAPPVNGKYVVFVTVSNLQPEETHVGRGTSSVSLEAALTMAQSHIPRKTNTYPYVKIDVVTGVKRYEQYDYYNAAGAGAGGTSGGDGDDDEDGSASAAGFNHLPSRWFGLALNWDTDWVFLAEEVQHNALVDKDRMIRWERLALYAAKSGRTDGAFALPDFSDASIMDYVDLFHTESIMMDMTKNEYYPLYHGHRMYSTLSPTLLLDRAKEAGAYLAQIVKDTGRQVYRYHPRSDYEPFGYNLSRHAGTLHAMACIFREWQDSYLKASMTLTLNYLRQSMEDCPIPTSIKEKENTTKEDTTIKEGTTQRKTAKCIVEYETENKRKVSKLGVNAMAILAIVEYVDVVQPDDAKELLALASSLADYIMACQVFDDGNFIHKIQFTTTTADDKKNGASNHVVAVPDEDFFSRYHLGQVTFALARMTNLSLLQKDGHINNNNKKKMDQWISTALRATKYMIDADAEEEDAEFDIDHWLMYGIAELHAIEQQQLLQEEKSKKKDDKVIQELVSESMVQHVIRTVRLAHKYQNSKIDDQDFDDYDRLGIYYDDLSSTATANKAEGLCVVLDLLQSKTSKDAETRNDWKTAYNSAVLAVRYQLQTQFQPEVAQYMRQPQRIMGGFHNSILDTDLRNDFTHHNLLSLLCLAHDMIQRGLVSTN